VNESDYEDGMANFYESRSAFGYSLTGNQDDASELTQEAFYHLLTREGMVGDSCKIKSWLFTTLDRVFLDWERRRALLPHFENSTVESGVALVTQERMDVLLDSAVRDSLLERVHLAVIDRAALKDARGGSPMFDRIGRAATISWSGGNHTDIIASTSGVATDLMNVF
jgi:DNA-directed RNA polymerase specialized sigma24 family protein